MRLMPAQFVRPFVKVEQERLRGCGGIAEAADPRTFGFALRRSAIAAHQDCHSTDITRSFVLQCARLDCSKEQLLPVEMQRPPRQIARVLGVCISIR